MSRAARRTQERQRRGVFESVEPKQIPPAKIVSLKITKFAHRAILAELTVLFHSGEPCLMATDVVGHNFTWHYREFWMLFWIFADVDKDIKQSVGEQSFSPFERVSNCAACLSSLDLNTDGFARVGVRAKNIHAFCISSVIEAIYPRRDSPQQRNIHSLRP